MNDSSYGVLNAMTDIIASPTRALDEIREHTNWLWVPLLILISLSSAAFAYYYSWVDFPWLVDETIAAMPAENRAAAEEGVRSFMSPTSSIAITIASILFISVVIYALQAVYLHLVTKLTSSGEYKFSQWFSLAVWTSFVGVFGAIAMFVVMFMADSNQLPQNALTPLSINELFIGAKAGDDWFNWGNSLNLLQVWSIALMALGYHRWTQSSMIKSIIIAALPWTLIFGIWAATI